MKPTFGLLAGLIALGAVVVLSSCAISGKPGPSRSQAEALRELRARIDATREPAILFVGNSYSFGISRELNKLTRKAGRAVRYRQVTHNGWSLARHASDPATLAAIRNGNWDVVVLQEYSTHPANPVDRETMMIPAVRFLANEIRNNGSIPVLYQTWGRKFGDQSIPRDSFDTMNQRVREGYQLASSHSGGLAIIPAGDAWEKELESNPNAPLFQPDHHHPTMAGDKITARVFHQALFDTVAP